MKTVAIIPARGGSKGIPGKNIMDFCGKPLIAWSIIQALNTPEIDEVYVSSDSDEILAVAAEYGARLIKRPVELAGDKATSESALQHALTQIEDSADTIVMLQATSPLRKPDDLTKGLRQYRLERLDSMFSGAVLDDFLIWQKLDNEDLESFNYNYLDRGRRQDRKPQYVENGSFYCFSPKILQQGNRLGGKKGIYLMDFWQTFEIDSWEDIDIVKTLFSLKLKNLYLKEGVLDNE